VSISDIAISETKLKKVAKKKRGRPEMDVKPTVIRLAKGQPARIEAAAGSGKMAEFIRAAVEAELKRLEGKR
jgi:hypothetical protein